MKKTLALLTAAIISTTVAAASNTVNMNTQINDLQEKLQRVKRINELETLRSTQRTRLDEITRKLKDSESRLSLASERLKASQTQVNALSNDNSSLSNSWSTV
jgi:chromosome segregation ATPase